MFESNLKSEIGITGVYLISNLVYLLFTVTFDTEYTMFDDIKVFPLYKLKLSRIYIRYTLNMSGSDDSQTSTS